MTVGEGTATVQWRARNQPSITVADVRACRAYAADLESERALRLPE